MNLRLLPQFDDSVRRRGRYVGRRVEYLPRVTRVTGPTADQLDNRISWTDLDDATVDIDTWHNEELAEDVNGDGRVTSEYSRLLLSGKRTSRGGGRWMKPRST